MNYETFRKEIIEQHGDFFKSSVDVFFEKAVEFATNENYEDALEIANDIIVLVKYANIGYEVVYLIGMLCQIHLDNDQPNIAERFFKIGMQILDQNSEYYDEDINKFLDLKIVIEEELGKGKMNEKK